MIGLEQRPVSEIVGDVFEGLTKTPKSLPPRLFYDAAGSALFEEITRLPEYYLTRTESRLLKQYSSEIAKRIGANVSVIELGAGTAAKTGTILKALSQRQLRVNYYPVDISVSALQVAEESLNGSYPQVRVHPVATNYIADSQFLESVSGRKLVLYLGSSIGNFEPDEAQELLQRMRAHMQNRRLSPAWHRSGKGYKRTCFPHTTTRKASPPASIRMFWRASTANSVVISISTSSATLHCGTRNARASRCTSKAHLIKR